MGKIRFKRKSKGIKLKYVMCIFIVFLITISVGYSLLSTKLTIFGSIVGERTKYPYGNTKYTYEKRYLWGSGNTPYMYDVHMTLLNLDEDYYESVEICFDINDGFLPEESTNNCGIWQASSLTKEGNRVTIIFTKSASWLPSGTPLELYFQFPFANEADIEITNLTLNGKLATFVTEL